ncbi:MAG: VWA domain-containing protein, partial [Candidatus Bipolaricaulota bacterium]
EEASLAVVFLLDRSSSMRGHAAGATKIRILQEAAAASVRILEEDDLAGVLAFDREFAWLSPIERVDDGERIYDRLRALTAEGGTDIYFPVVEALDRLSEVSARVKHIILLSDGKTVDEYRDFPGLYRRLMDGEIGISAVAIGELPNLPLLRSLTEASGGALYEAADITELPEISVRATQQLSRGRFITGSIEVDGPLLGADAERPPALDGYSLTYAKPTAETLLTAGDDPLFARWRYGGGRTAVLNTDLSARWSSPWFAWEGAATLFDRMLAAIEPDSPVTPGLEVSLRLDGDMLVAHVDARDVRGAFVNGLDLTAHILPTDVVEAAAQIGAGLYAVQLPVPDRGGYALQVVDHSRQRRAALAFSVPYRAEYRATGLDVASLEAVASSTGGRVLDEDDVLPPFPESTGGRRGAPCHLPFLYAALAVILTGLALRKMPRWRPASR